MTTLRWRASSTRSKPNSSITSIMQPARTPDVISLPTSNASPLGHRISQPDRDGAKSSLTLSIFSEEDQMYAGSAVPNEPVIPVEEFPELAKLRDNWQTIREEAVRLFDEGFIRAAARNNDWVFTRSSK